MVLLTAKTHDTLRGLEELVGVDTLLRLWDIHKRLEE